MIKEALLPLSEPIAGQADKKSRGNLTREFAKKSDELKLNILGPCQARGVLKAKNCTGEATIVANGKNVCGNCSMRAGERQRVHEAKGISRRLIGS